MDKDTDFFFKFMTKKAWKDCALSYFIESQIADNQDLAKQMLKGYKSKRLSNYQLLDELLTGKETNKELLQFFTQNIGLCIEKCADNVCKSVVKGFPSYYSLKINRGESKSFMVYQDNQWHIEYIGRTKSAFKAMLKNSGHWYHFKYLTMLSIYGIELDIANKNDTDLCIWLDNGFESGWLTGYGTTLEDLDNVSVFDSYEYAEYCGKMETQRFYWDNSPKDFYICRKENLLNFRKHK